MAKQKKSTSSKKSPSARASRAPRGEELVVHVLAAKSVTVAAAEREPPSLPSATLLLEAERAISAYRKARGAFMKVPTFDHELADAARGLLEHATAVDGDWQKARFAKRRGENRGAVRKEAEALRAGVLKSARFFFRDNPAALLEVDRIAEGEGLADLLRDLDDIAALVRAHAALFAQVPRLGDVPKRAGELGAALREASDLVPAADLLAARNRAVVAVELALREIRAAARFLYEGSPKALAPYLSASTAARAQASRAKKAAAKAARANGAGTHLDP